MKNINIADTIETHLDKICSEWSCSSSTLPLLHRLQVNEEMHKETVALPVILHLLSILKNEKEPGDCPTIRQVVETFYYSGLSVEDVFLHCTTLKNIIIDLLVEHRVESQPRQEVAALLDGNLYNIINLYTQKQRLQESRHELYSQIIEEHVVLTATDTEGAITYVTDAFCDLSGYSKQELMGKKHTLIRHPDMKESFFASMWGQILAGKSWKGKIKNRTKDGGEFIAKTEIIPVKDSHDAVTEYIAIRHDITEKELSEYDPLTNLYNRRAFDRLFKKALAANNTLSLMILDLDHFKRVNDTFGHTVGDSVINAFAFIVVNGLGEYDVAARWGGEEFVVFLPGSPLSNTRYIAEGIRERLAKTPVIDSATPQIDGNDTTDTSSCYVTCSIGISQFQKGDDVKTLFDRADRNLFRAKESGRNRVVAE